ncbi:MAG: FtsX-like permease family protein [Actinobacteria bacterium]|nr:FtsX-like permease family protein [Actinomycetota bacterium]MBV9254442.1 FtsX-like permease family protein [Actinomycetota bacterium]MBV9666267.1 FtsX-like permease family protein [Actinomycetota bacterium]MBV9933876.1 FtsX-like permease family protein [Actinomycetota bacterium]
MNARRAVVRWAVRLFRREWRQQVLVLALLTVAVAGAILAATAAYTTVPNGEGEFGSARTEMIVNRPGPTLAADVASVEHQLGPVEVMTHRYAPVPGSVETLELRAQQPNGRFRGSTLALREGRYPTASDEIAVTGGAGRLLAVRVGSHINLDGAARTVVGKVENPADLSDDFVLVPPAAMVAPETATIFTSASRQQISVAAFGPERGPAGRAVASQVRVRGSSDRTIAAVSVLTLAAVVLLLVCLVAAAGFAVIAQRRTRQMGMLATVGGTDRHLRLVVLANGFVVGAIAAVVGAVVALTGWIATAPMLDSLAGHRINRFDIAWWVFGAGMLLAVVTATAAAWWPARSMARIPVTEALSARPPRPRPVHRSAAVAVVLLAGGFAAMAAGIDTKKDHANPFALLGGTLALTVGLLFLTPTAIRALARVARRLPVAARLALRDLGRYQSRSSAALGAISLGLAIAVAVVLILSANIPDAHRGNLSDRQLFVHMGNGDGVPDTSPADAARLQAATQRIAGAVGASTVVPLQVAADRGLVDAPKPGGGGGAVIARAGTNPAPGPGALHPTVQLTWRLNASHGGVEFRGLSVLYVATPELLAFLGVDKSATDGVDVLAPASRLQKTNSGESLALLDFMQRDSPSPKVRTIRAQAYTAAPTMLITPQTVAAHGWDTLTGGWILEAHAPLTEAQRSRARSLAADAGLTIETRNRQTRLATARTVATGAGALLALAILAMTVGLIRAEAAGDVRMLTAAGAGSRTRRTLTAATAGALALLGVLLGVGGAYAAVIAGYLHHLTPLGRVPIVHLLVTVLGIPVGAAVAGWLLAGREPPFINRVVME